MIQSTLDIESAGRGPIEITVELNKLIPPEFSGLAHLFLKHTSASLTITENADPTVLGDLETIISRLAPDGDSEYRHDYEGDDDMAAHVRSVLTCTELTIPVRKGRLDLGTWQGVFLWEHRYRPHRRSMIVSLLS